MNTDVSAHDCGDKFREMEAQFAGGKNATFRHAHGTITKTMFLSQQIGLFQTQCE